MVRPSDSSCGISEWRLLSKMGMTENILRRVASAWDRRREEDSLLFTLSTESRRVAGLL